VETAQGVKFTEVDTSDAAATAKLPENASPVAQAASSGGAPMGMIAVQLVLLQVLLLWSSLSENV